MKKQNKLERSDSNDALKRRRASLFKIGAVMILAFIVWVFSSIAWFTMNNDVANSGMGVKVGGQNFEVTMLSGSRDGIFKNPYHIAVHDEDALYWQMTPTNNLINYNVYVDDEHPGDEGLHPNTEGVISFNVIPKKDSVDLKFDFEIIGYQALYNDVNNTPTDGTDDVLAMTPLSQLDGGDGITAQNLLNGHILFFEHRDDVTENGVTTVTYSTPICSDEDMHRLMYRTVTGKNTATPINIYWVWPNTLSTFVDASASGVDTIPFCHDDDSHGYNSYTAITNNIEAFPQYYLKGTSSGDTVNVATIGAHYVSYGDRYDQGDNEIGMRVHYLLIKLSVTEGTAVGGGP